MRVINESGRSISFTVEGVVYNIAKGDTLNVNDKKSREISDVIKALGIDGITIDFEEGSGTSAISASLVTKLLYVDMNREDDYVADGSIFKPFKTISDAASVATSGMTISVMGGSYEEDIVIPAGVSLTSNGLNQVSILGDATFEGPASSQSIRGFIFTGENKTLTINCTMNIFECYSYSKVVFGANAHISGYVFNVNVNEEDADAITFNGSGDLNMTGATIKAKGDSHAIVVNSGRIALFGCEVESENAAKATIISNGGNVVFINSQVVNTNGTSSIDLNGSNAVGTNPNVLSGVISVGSIDCGAVPTIKEGIQFLVAGSLTGTEIITNRIEKNGIDGSFTTVDGKTITVVDGQITEIADI